jgi:hypothetical protein
MRYLLNTGEMHSDLSAARAARHGHYCGSTRQIFAAGDLIHRFTCGNPVTI